MLPQASIKAVAKAPAHPMTGTGDVPNPVDHNSRPFNTLSYGERSQLKKNMLDAVFMNSDDFSKNEANTPSLWLSQVKQNVTT